MRSLFTAALLAASTLGAVTAPAHAATMIGMGDQSAKLFEDARFTSLSKVKVVRYIGPWDVANNPVEKAKADAWIAAAKSKGYKVHFTFNYSYTTPQKNPSVKAYTKATKLFVTEHKKDVESWGVFNEVNRGKAAGRFTTPGPKLAAQLYTAFTKSVCKGCRVVGIDLLDGVSVKPTLKYLTSFNRYVKASARPKIVGFHNYSDTNRKSMSRTAALLKAVGKRPQVWITETGGLYEFGKSFKADANRQAASVRQVFKITKKYKQIKRVIFYNFYGPGVDHPNDVFDAGLISGEGIARPSYDVFASFAK